jgi:hypothetical protein
METVWKKRIQKPMGVYVCTFLIFLRFGIINFFSYLLAFRDSDGDAELPVVVISLALCVFTAGAAVWAVTGQNEGRIALLVMLPLNILWILFFAVSGLLNEDKADDAAAVKTIIQQALISLAVIGVEWYL